VTEKELHSTATDNSLSFWTAAASALETAALEEERVKAVVGYNPCSHSLYVPPLAPTIVTVYTNGYKAR
jgi:hypothetical protein